MFGIGGIQNGGYGRQYVAFTDSISITTSAPVAITFDGVTVEGRSISGVTVSNTSTTLVSLGSYLTTFSISGTYGDDLAVDDIYKTVTVVNGIVTAQTTYTSYSTMMSERSNWTTVQYFRPDPSREKIVRYSFTVNGSSQIFEHPVNLVPTRHFTRLENIIDSTVTSRTVQLYPSLSQITVDYLEKANGGSGYTNGYITFSGTGTPANAYVEVFGLPAGNGAVRKITLNSPGNYTTTPTANMPFGVASVTWTNGGGTYGNGFLNFSTTGSVISPANGIVEVFAGNGAIYKITIVSNGIYTSTVTATPNTAGNGGAVIVINKANTYMGNGGTLIKTNTYSTSTYTVDVNATPSNTTTTYTTYGQ